MTTLSRTFRRRSTGEFLPGLGGEDEQVDVSRFSTQPVKFAAEGKPETDDFLLADDAYTKMGEPERIKVTVETA